MFARVLAGLALGSRFAPFSLSLLSVSLRRVCVSPLLAAAPPVPSWGYSSSRRLWRLRRGGYRLVRTRLCKGWRGSEWTTSKGVLWRREKRSRWTAPWRICAARCVGTKRSGARCIDGSGNWRSNCVHPSKPMRLCRPRSTGWVVGATAGGSSARTRHGASLSKAGTASKAFGDKQPPQLRSAPIDSRRCPRASTRASSGPWGKASTAPIAEGAAARSARPRLACPALARRAVTAACCRCRVLPLPRAVAAACCCCRTTAAALGVWSGGGHPRPSRLACLTLLHAPCVSHSMPLRDQREHRTATIVITAGGDLRRQRRPLQRRPRPRRPRFERRSEHRSQRPH